MIQTSASSNASLNVDEFAREDAPDMDFVSTLSDTAAGESDES